jgi:hypothetical protein
MQHSAEMLRCLAELDVVGVRKLWSHVAPGIAPLDDHKTIVALHMARTQTISLDFRLRAHSHRWLVDNGYQSQLPDELRPRAERLYPKAVASVGISVNMRSPILAPAAPIVQAAMSEAVLDAYAEGRTDPMFLRSRMFEARERTIAKLFGRKP